MIDYFYFLFAYSLNHEWVLNLSILMVSKYNKKITIFIPLFINKFI